MNERKRYLFIHLLRFSCKSEKYILKNLFKKT